MWEHRERRERRTRCNERRERVKWDLKARSENFRVGPLNYLVF